MARVEDDLAVGETEAAVDATGPTRPEGATPDPAPAALSELGSMASALGAIAATPSPRRALIQRGEIIDGMYRVGDAIGEGGMGVVYLARDVRLDRDVAIKLGTAVSTVGLARANREAMALARLSHPNVVVVYQVGELDGRLYIAMEYVAGGNARQWAKAAARGWREIVALYAAAGDGLAAAHAVGLVHRDFKPDNVLVGDDGRPRVGDFGLAREASKPDDDATADAPAPTSDEITQTGAMLGTPGYMPPEQLAGEDVDARADQFAFCVALWEALFDQRPFAGRTPAELMAAIARGAVRDPGRTAVPRHVIEALRRGLADDRGARWPSMQPLLAELRRDPRARRRRALAIAGAAAVVVVAGAIAMWPRAPAPDACDDGAAQITSAWNPAHAQLLRVALDARGAAAASAADRTIATLDDRARRWSVAYRAVCRSGAQGRPPTEVARGMECLAGRRDQIADAATLMSGRGPESAEHIDALLAAIEPPETCASAAYLASAVPPPADPRRAAAVAIEQRALAHANQLEIVGRTRDAQIIDSAVLAAAFGLGYEPLIASALTLRGEIVSDRGDYRAAFTDLSDAYFRAHQSKAMAIAAGAADSATIALLNVSRYDDAAVWARLADDDARNVADTKLRTKTLLVRSMAATDTNDGPGSIDLANQAIAFAGPIGEPLLVAQALQARAEAYTELARHADAAADLRRAIELVERTLGPEHPKLINFEIELGGALREMGQYKDAIAIHREALALAERVDGPDSADVGDILDPLGTELGIQGQPEQGLADLDRALAIAERTEGARTYNVGSTQANRALLLAKLHRYDESVAASRRAIDIMTEVAPDDPTLASQWSNLGEVQMDAGRTHDARASIAQAIALWEKLAPDNLTFAYALTTSGRLRLAAQDLVGARADLERALALRQATGVDPDLRAMTELYLADVVWKLGDHDRAADLGRAATDDWHRSDFQPDPAQTKILDEVLGKDAVRAAP